MAQQVEHVLGKDEVTGSSPVSSSKVFPEQERLFFAERTLFNVSALLINFYYSVLFSVSGAMEEGTERPTT